MKTILKRISIVITCICMLSMIACSNAGNNGSDNSGNNAPELTMEEKIVIATLQGCLRSRAENINDTYEQLLSTFKLTKLEVRHFTEDNHNNGKLTKEYDKYYIDLIDDGYILKMNYEYITSGNKLVIKEDVYSMVYQDGSARFYTIQDNNNIMDELLRDCFDSVSEAVTINTDAVMANLSDQEISIEVQRYLKSLE
ncbi:MAG: hypothetical protein NC223_05785 [Butyrivibrio sp.]|nr:hypothetical protein [Butyrivibrio sp.]